MSDDIQVEQFVVTCRRCSAPATVNVRDNGGCGDPECCEYVRYVAFACGACQTTEELY